MEFGPRRKPWVKKGVSANPARKSQFRNCGRNFCCNPRTSWLCFAKTHSFPSLLSFLRGPTPHSSLSTTVARCRNQCQTILRKIRKKFLAPVLTDHPYCRGEGLPERSPREVIERR